MSEHDPRRRAPTGVSASHYRYEQTIDPRARARSDCTYGLMPSISTLGITPSPAANRSRVGMVGTRYPRSTFEMKVGCSPAASASASWVNPASCLAARTRRPNSAAMDWSELRSRGDTSPNQTGAVRWVPQSTDKVRSWDCDSPRQVFWWRNGSRITVVRLNHLFAIRLPTSDTHRVGARSSRVRWWISLPGRVASRSWSTNCG